MDTLPNEIITHILVFLDPVDRYICKYIKIFKPFIPEKITVNLYVHFAKLNSMPGIKWTYNLEKKYPTYYRWYIFHQPSPSIYAAKNGNMEMLEWMEKSLEECPSSNMWDKSSVLQRVVECGHLHLIKNITNPEDLFQYYEIACKKGHLDVLKWYAENNYFPKDHYKKYGSYELCGLHNFTTIILLSGNVETIKWAFEYNENEWPFYYSDKWDNGKEINEFLKSCECDHVLKKRGYKCTNRKINGYVCKEHLKTKTNKLYQLNNVFGQDIQ